MTDSSGRYPLDVSLSVKVLEGKSAQKEDREEQIIAILREGTLALSSNAGCTSRASSATLWTAIINVGTMALDKEGWSVTLPFPS